MVHSLLVDVSVFKAVFTINHFKDSNKSSFNNILTSYEERTNDLTIKVTRYVSDAHIKLDYKNDGI